MNSISTKNTPQLLRSKKNALIRARCSEKLRERLERIAAVRELDISDVVREDCLNYAAKCEQMFAA